MFCAGYIVLKFSLKVRFATKLKQYEVLHTQYGHLPGRIVCVYAVLFRSVAAGVFFSTCLILGQHRFV